MNNSEQLRELSYVIELDFTCKQRGFPVLVGLGNSGHPDQVMPLVFKQQRRGCTGRRKPREPFQSARLAMDADRIAEPIGFDAQFWERLLDDKWCGPFALHQYRAIRNSSCEHPNRGVGI